MLAGGVQIQEIEDIKKDPALALKRIKEIEDKERKHGPTEFSERRKSELKQLHQSLLKRDRREQEEKQRQEKIAEAARAKQREQEAAARAKQREQEEEAAAAAFAANAHAAASAQGPPGPLGPGGGLAVGQAWGTGA